MSEEASSRVLAEIDDARSEIVKAVRGLIGVPSVNPNYPGIREQDYLGHESEANLLLRDQFGHLFDKAEMLGSRKKRENFAGVVSGSGGGRSLLLNGHVDVVPAGGRDRGNTIRFPQPRATDASMGEERAI